MLPLGATWILLLLSFPGYVISQTTNNAHEFSNKMSEYLEFYHEDFSKLKFEILEHPSFTTLVIRASDTTPISSVKLDFHDSERSMFEAVASLYMNPDKTGLPVKHVSRILSVWFWDYKSWKNPAYLDFLAEQFLSDELCPSNQSETVAFWKYLTLIHRYHGRKQLWNTLRNDLSIIDYLDPATTISPQELANLVAYITLTASPVQTPNESQLFLRSLTMFPIWVEDHLQLLPLSELSDLTLMSPAMKRAYRMQIKRIKIQLPTINPLFLNPIRSLGVSYEALLENDLTEFRQAFACFENDQHFASQIYEEIK